MLKNLFIAVGALAALSTNIVHASLDFCLGWNTNCQQPQIQDINLIKVGPVDVSCENCYLEVKGSVKLDLDPFTIGMENLLIGFSGEIDSAATGTWSFDKNESPTLVKIELMHGLIPVTLEIPMTVDIQGSVTGDAQSKIGIQAIGNIGSWESKHENGHWKHVYPTPYWDIKHSVQGSVKVNGDFMITVSPVIQLTVGDIFTGELAINQVAGMNLQLVNRVTRPGIQGLSDGKCTLCQFVVGEVEQLMLSNSSLAFITSEMTRICELFPKTMQQGCNAVVQSYLPTIIQFLEQEITPQEICAKLSLCQQMVGGSTECQLCNMVSAVAEQMLADGSVQQAIESGLDKICSELGSTANLCQSLVNTYLPTIIQYVETKLPPALICSKLKFCPQIGMRLMRYIQPTPVFSSCVTFQEDFDIDWRGELKIKLFNMDKTFDEKLMHWQRTVPVGETCATRLPRQNSWVDANEIIREVNSRSQGWEATHNKYSHSEYRDLKRMLLDSHKLKRGLASIHHTDVSSFDSRTKWPGCVHPVRNQLQCGSCWAFSASEVASDRICISQGKDVVLSPEYILECDSSDMGCNGGELDLVWNFLTKTGTTSDSCRPYTSGSGTVGGICSQTCSDGTPVQLFKANSNKAVIGEQAIINEVLKNGPIQVAFQVYQDFMHYKSGVYTHTSGSLLGGHAVELVGWDVVNGVKAWIIKNSWDTTWGDQGYFMIKRGSDECGIESNGYTGYF